MTERGESHVTQAKLPCPSCPSSDGFHLYSDGHGYCFVCAYYEPGDDHAGRTSTRSGQRKSVDKKFIRGESLDLIKRGIRKDTCALFGYTVGERDGKPVQIAPYYKDGELVAQHIRDAKKDFAWIGEPKGCELFGQHLWRDHGKKVVVTEGEIDCLTVSQLQGNKWPVVSLPNGAQSAKKYLAANLEWLEKFDEVILMFDMDDAGKDAIANCAPLFTPGKCKVATLPLKDANECLQQGKGAAVVDAIWGAKVYRPDGVVGVEDVLADCLKPLVAGLPWCFKSMNDWTYGRRDGEVYAFGAGTGVGKTDLFTQQIAFDVDELGITCGVIYLEQNPRETVLRVAGKMAGKVFHVPGEASQEDKEAAVKALAGTGRLYLYDHFGSTDFDLILGRIRYMVVSLGCKHIYLDHLTALVANEDDEKKALDSIMAKLAGQAQELRHKLHFISHLATPEGKPHEEGGRVMVRHFRGSRAIGFWSHFMFGLERDQQAEDEAERHTTTLRCLKDRPTGRGTGKTLRLTYDSTTGLLAEEGESAADHGF